MPVPERSVRHAAMDLLSRREHGRRELERKLAQRYGPKEVDETLQRLAKEGLQSDPRFALSFARERVLRGFGPLRIQQELLKRGVSGNVADRALQALEREESIDWQRVAREVLLKKFGDGELPRDFADRAKRLRFLQYRGFAETDLSEEEF
jgi:regulatory protein